MTVTVQVVPGRLANWQVRLTLDDPPGISLAVATDLFSVADDLSASQARALADKLLTAAVKLGVARS